MHQRECRQDAAPKGPSHQRRTSASVTCRLQHRSLFAYLGELLTAHPRGVPFPTLT